MNRKLLDILINTKYGKKTDDEQRDFMAWLWHYGGLKHYGLEGMPESLFSDTFNYYWDMPVD
jgi:hypothetical protein